MAKLTSTSNNDSSLKSRKRRKSWVASSLVLILLPMILAWVVARSLVLLSSPRSSPDPYSLLGQDFDLEEIARLSRNKRIVITGANAGLGFSTAKLLATAGTARVVILACRSIKKCTHAKAEIEEFVRGSEAGSAPTTELVPLHLDLTTISSIRTFASQVPNVLRKFDRSGSEDDGERDDDVPGLDILINNAGIMGVPHQLAEDTGAELQMHVNHLGHFALTALLMDYLDASVSGGGRVVSVSSLAAALSPRTIQRLARMLPPCLRPIPAYASSKRANLLFTLGLNRRLASSKNGGRVRAVAAHPGYSRTSITRKWSFAPPFLRDFFARNAVGSMSSDAGALSQLRAALDADHVGANDYVGPLFGIVGRPALIGTAARSFHHWPVDVDSDANAEVDDLWEFSERAWEGHSVAFRFDRSD